MSAWHLPKTLWENSTWPWTNLTMCRRCSRMLLGSVAVSPYRSSAVSPKTDINIARNDFDATSIRDNLRKLHESQGNTSLVRKMRDNSAQDKMILLRFPCISLISFQFLQKTISAANSWKQCPLSAINTFSSRDELKACAECACVLYWTQKCQRMDWRRHKKYEGGHHSPTMNNGYLSSIYSCCRIVEA